MAELPAALEKLTNEELIVRAVANNDLMLQIEGYSRTLVRSDIDWRTREMLLEIVARQESILTRKGLINNNAERVARPT